MYYRCCFDLMEFMRKSCREFITMSWRGPCMDCFVLSHDLESKEHRNLILDAMGPTVFTHSRIFVGGALPRFLEHRMNVWTGLALLLANTEPS